MRALVLNGPNDVRCERVADPGLRDGRSAIVRITRTSICGSDLHLVHGTVPAVPGTIIGHEGVGIVEDVGRDVQRFHKGQRVIVPVHGFGKVAVDIAYGGNWFAFVEAEQLGLAVEKLHLPVLLQAATAVREGLVREGVRGRHPERSEEEIVDHVKLFAELEGSEPGSRAMTLCPGAAYDRSPCGTGTSAKLAVLHAKGELQTGQWFVSESVIGTRFRARVVKETKVGALAAIVPEVEGSAWITGFPTFVLDPEDPCRYGI